MSSLRTTKPQITKLTKSKHKELTEVLAKLNRELKRQGRHSEQMTFDQYFDYLHGKRTATTKNAKSQKIPAVYRRETSGIPSLNSAAGIAPKQEPQRYTGTLVKGIAQTHKSNAVPVINQEEIIDIARMRR